MNPRELPGEPWAGLPPGLEGLLREYRAAVGAAEALEALEPRVQSLREVVRAVELELARDLARRLAGSFDALPLAGSASRFRKRRGTRGWIFKREAHDLVRARILVAVPFSADYLGCVCVDEEGDLQLAIARGRIDEGDPPVLAPQPHQVRVGEWTMRPGGWDLDRDQDVPIEPQQVIAAARAALENARLRLSEEAEQLERRKKNLGL